MTKVECDRCGETINIRLLNIGTARIESDGYGLKLSPRDGDDEGKLSFDLCACCAESLRFWIRQGT